MTQLVGALALLGCIALASAHTHLVKAIPADGSTVTVSPPKFVLTFADAARLTMLSLQKNGGPAQKLGPLPTDATAQISIPAPQLTAGKYVLSWRAVSADGHVMPGKLGFTVAASGATTNAPGATGS